MSEPDEGGQNAVPTIYDDPTRRPDQLTIPIEHYADRLPAARRILSDTGAASLHEHAVYMPRDLDEAAWAEWRQTGREVLAVTELAASEYRMLVTSCLALQDFDAVLGWAETITAQREHADLQGTRVVLGLEDLGSTGGELDRLEQLYAAGIRVAGIAYNTGNPFGTGLAHSGPEGLSELGRTAVTVMNQLGMTIDLAHTSEATALDTVEITRAPVVLSHAGAAAIWPSSRMKSDDVIRAVASTGGLIGIEAAPGSTRTRHDDGAHSIDDVVKHVTHCAELVGVEHVAIGGDTFYGDHLALYRVGRSTPLAPDGAVPLSVDYVAGAENASELPLQLSVRLLADGWAAEEVAAVIGGNAIRVLRSTVTAH